MKTMKKVAIGMIFLAPLFLPATTQAGPGETGWFESIHSFFSGRGSRSGTGNGFGTDRNRPSYDPYTNGRPGCPPPPARGGSGSGGNSVPVNGGLVFLLAAGLALGAKRAYDLKMQGSVI
jgi:hypothetical protein